MKKIGLVTLYNNNYGSILQCYATKIFVEQYGFECEILYLKNSQKKILKKIRALIRLFYRSVKYKHYFRHYLNMRKALRIEGTYVSQDSLDKMNLFVQDQLNPKGYTRKELKKIGRNQEYSAFIAGSDQIWNASRQIAPFYFLQFAPKMKRIALAPSFGIEKVPPYYWNSIKKGLLGFDRISVREETGKKIVKKLTGKDAIRLADPTFFLDDKQWRDFYSQIELINEKYIFMHFLGKPNQVAIDSINWLADYYKCRVVCFANMYEENSDIKGILCVNGGPREYLGLIDNAEAVCTDSFHTTLFSINLNIPFYTFSRQYLHNFPQNARILDLLERYELSERLVSSIEQLKVIYNIEIHNCASIVDNERNILINYLKNEINQRIS